jgi:hypothetical protein
METLRRLYARLRLRVNEAKSAVARVWDRKFLGYSMWVAKGQTVKLRVAAKAVNTFKATVREITGRAAGRSLSQVAARLTAFLRGWKPYFALADTPGIFDDLDKWIHRRLRALQLKQWKRGPTIYRELKARGVPKPLARAAAAHGRRWWAMATHGALKTAMPTRSFDRLGIPRLAPH